MAQKMPRDLWFDRAQGRVPRTPAPRGRAAGARRHGRAAPVIGRLTGRMAERAADHALIDVGGVGYMVHCSDRTLAALPAEGAPVTLHTDLMVREDLLQLFGFATRVEREWYRLLIGVQGIGAKAALAILGSLGPDATGRAIALGDWASVATARGVGPKTAQRVVNELRDKAPAILAMAGGPEPAPTEAAEPPDPTVTVAPPRAAPPPAGPAPVADALSALANLGYAPTDAAQAVTRAADADPHAETPALIRAALRLLAPKG